MKKSTIILSTFLLIILISVTIFLYSHRQTSLHKPQQINEEAWLTSCITKKETQNQGFFNPGDLMVTFSADLDIQTAQNILLSHNLITPEQFLPQWPWPHAAPGILLIKVPIQEEFKWICLLEKEVNIANVSLNQISTIHTNKTDEI